LLLIKNDYFDVIQITWYI